ncbi:MAG: ATP-binding protein [Chloroflexota bacterium]|nr:ATP-binding protein [Chloroflexota bacterium]
MQQTELNTSARQEDKVAEINVLLVEDDAEDIHLARLAMSKSKQTSFNITVCERLSKAIELMQTASFDIALLDLNLPDSKGISIVARILAENPKIPVIVLTGTNSEEIGIQALKSGAEDYMVKGPDIQNSLTRAIRYAIERKRTTEALLDSEEKYSTLVELSNEGILLVKDSAIIFANRQFYEITGLEEPDVIGKNYLELLSYTPSNESDGESADCAETSIAKTINVTTERGTARFHETSFIKESGEAVWFEINTNPITYRGGPSELVLLRDITKRKQVEQEKQFIEEQLQLASRLATVGELAAGVAHELNNPLAVIQMFAEFLKGDQELSTTTRRDLDTIHKEALRAARITSNLLSFARKQRPEKVLLSVNTVLTESLPFEAYPTSNGKTEISMELEPDLPLTFADFYQIQQVFLNIIMNAQQAISEVQDKGKILIKTRKVGEMIQVSFTDNGPGIPEHDTDKIFDPFFTTKEVGKGTGLGLSICFGIIQRHGGYLYARNNPDRGTTFFVEIPIVQEKPFSDEQIK